MNIMTTVAEIKKEIRENLINTIDRLYMEEIITRYLYSPEILECFMLSPNVPLDLKEKIYSDALHYLETNYVMNEQDRKACTRIIQRYTKELEARTIDIHVLERQIESATQTSVTSTDDMSKREYYLGIAVGAKSILNQLTMQVDAIWKR